MLCKVVKYDDSYIIEHVTDRYFDIGECTICDEFAYGWFPVIHSLEADIRTALSSGCIIYISNMAEVNSTRLLKAANVSISGISIPPLEHLQELLDVRLDLLDSIKTIDIYATLTILTVVLSDGDLSTEEKRIKVEELDNFYRKSSALDTIETKINELKSRISV